MSKNAIISVDSEGLGVSPTDAAAWVRVESVFAALTTREVSNISEALAYAGVARTTFYQDVKKPWIAQKLAEFLGALDKATMAVIMARRFEILAHQQDIASGHVGEPRDSTPAARYVEQVLDKLRESPELEEEHGIHEATKWLNRVKGQGKVTARRTTVTEEVEIAPDGPETIDITP
jgi:hypothetical protein